MFYKKNKKIINFISEIVLIPKIIKNIYLSRDRSRIMILSYPRSGNHLTRFIIEYISGRPTMGCYNNSKDTPIRERFQYNKSPLNHVECDKNFIAYKFHKVPFFNFIFKKRIIIIRNWKDAVMSHLKKGDNYSEDFIRKNLKSYFDILKNIKKEDLVIYYEDLLKKNKQTVIDIYDYLNIENDKYLNIFFNDIDFLYKESYKTPHDKTASNKNYNEDNKLSNKIEVVYEKMKKNNDL